MDISTASSEHSEAAAILMDVSQQPQPNPIIYTNYYNKQDQTGISNQQEHTVYSNQSQAAAILMNVGQGKDVPITKSTSDLMDVDEETMKRDDQETTVIVAADGTVQEMYSLSEGGLHSSIIQVDTPGRETETITVSGLTDNYNLESLAQIGDIVVNSADRGNSIVSLTDDKSVPQADGTSYTDLDQESQYIAMKDLDANKIVDVQTEESGDRNVKLLSSMNETKSPTAKTDPTDQKDQPQMFSAGSQTTRGFNPLPKPTWNSDEGPVIITQGTITNIGTDKDTQVVEEGSAMEESDFVQKKIKTEKIDEDEAQTDSQEAVDDDGANFDNCGHEVAKKKVHSDQPLPESRTTSVQTDVTASCYLNVSPDELSIHKRKITRHSYVNKRVYLDDPKPSTDMPDSYEVTVSPFLSRKSLIDRENAYFICGTCTARYTTAEELKIHSKAHKAKKALCPTCKKTCGNIKILADHVISHTECNTFKCSVCTTETIFTTAEDFKEHVKEHLDERYFICGSCNQKFIYVADLKVHMRVHTGEKPFECKECDADFSQKASLDVHVSSFHKKEKPFQCDHCGVSFARKTDLKIHTRKHTGERPYSCDVCDKTFTSNSGLTSHKKTHFRKRFHQCLDCEKSFDSPARLKQHVENCHSGEKPIRCRVCDREFKTREDVRSHMKTHSLEPYPCISCSFGTFSKECLTDHIKEKHPELVGKMPELFYGVDP